MWRMSSVLAKQRSAASSLKPLSMVASHMRTHPCSANGMHVKWFSDSHYHTVKSEGDVAKRHTSVLTAKTNEELEKAYDAYAEHYESDLQNLGHGENVAGRSAAKVLVQHATPESHPVLVDFGCGTGIAGVMLHEAGWRNMVACDLSQKMLDLVKARGIYSDTRKVILPDSGLEAESFDLVHAAGMFAPGQAPPSSFDEFLRVMKKGGLAIFSVRCHYYDGSEGAEHRKRLEELEKNGSWACIAKPEVPYLPLDEVNAYIFVMKKL